MDKKKDIIAAEKVTYLYANSPDDGHKYWFPMRVSYGRCARIVRELMDGNYGIEYFAPMEEKTILRDGKKEYYVMSPEEASKRQRNDDEGSSRSSRVVIRRDDYVPIAGDDGGETAKIVKVPMMASLIFFHATRTEIKELKSSMEPFTFLRFMTFIKSEDSVRNMTMNEVWSARRITVIPEVQMEQFMKVLEREQNHVTLIPYNSLEQYVGKRIRFIEGAFKGQEAIIRRVGKKQNKRFFFDLGNIVVARVDYIPKQEYEIIS